MNTDKYYKEQLEADQFYFESSCGKNLAITTDRDANVDDIATDLDTNEKVKLSTLLGVDAIRIDRMAERHVHPEQNKYGI